MFAWIIGYFPLLFFHNANRETLDWLLRLCDRLRAVAAVGIFAGLQMWRVKKGEEAAKATAESERNKEESSLYGWKGMSQDPSHRDTVNN